MGVLIENGACFNQVGKYAEKGERNIISGNKQAGVKIFGTNLVVKGNIVSDNFIGTKFDGNSKLSNGVGLTILGLAKKNIIGSSLMSESNVISGNVGAGVLIAGREANDNYIWGNKIGTNEAGTDSISNQIGVWITEGAMSNHVGVKEIRPYPPEGKGNVISGNRNIGILIEGTGTDGNFVQGNVIGADKNVTGRLPNGIGIGILRGPQNSSIGGGRQYWWVTRNVISGNKLIA